MTVGGTTVESDTTIMLTRGIFKKKEEVGCIFVL